MQNPEKANRTYESGFNCCQSVLSTFATEFNLDSDISLRLATGFTAGMAYQGKTCGAVLGAYMIIGLLKGSTYPADEYSREVTYGLIKEFNTEFIRLNNSIECKELLKKDVSKPDELDFIIRNRLFDINCPKYVREASKILDEILNKYK